VSGLVHSHDDDDDDDDDVVVVVEAVVSIVVVMIALLLVIVIVAWYTQCTLKVMQKAKSKKLAFLVNILLILFRQHFATHTDQSLLLLWRARLVAQFEAEGRNSTWIVNGKLQQRQSSQLYSPHYPVAPVYVGAPVNFQASQVGWSRFFASFSSSFRTQLHSTKCGT
jgi:hypothetical protein